MSYDLTAAQAAERLGVKQATLYAYVSRGVLSRVRAADGRSSLFDADEIERLALRGRPRRPPGAADIIVESQITEITADHLRFRGHDAVALATSRPFEDVAELLWTGTLPAADTKAANARSVYPAARSTVAGTAEVGRAGPGSAEMGDKAADVRDGWQASEGALAAHPDPDLPDVHPGASTGQRWRDSEAAVAARPGPDLPDVHPGVSTGQRWRDSEAALAARPGPAQSGARPGASAGQRWQASEAAVAARPGPAQLGAHSGASAGQRWRDSEAALAARPGPAQPGARPGASTGQRWQASEAAVAARPGPDLPDVRPGVSAGQRWQASEAAVAAGRAAQAALPAGTLPLERFQVIVPALAATDPLRLELDPVAVVAAARSIIAGMVDCLSAPATSASATSASAASASAASASAVPGSAVPDSAVPDSAVPDSITSVDDGRDIPIAVRLWFKLCDRRPTPALLHALSAALVLLADHELAASTLAARAAASVRADPYAVVATGLGAVGGALHGGSSLGAETLIASARGPADVPRVVAELLRRGERVPGFGHFVYKTGDPRAIALFDLIRRAAPKSAQLAIAEAVIDTIRRKSLPEPNIDFALATLTRVAGMTRGAGEAIFAVARTAGWIAHALEAYTTAPIRPRAIYTGPNAAR